jgi:ADP-ribosylglycohydrolase
MSGSLLYTDKGPGQTDLVKSLLFGVAVGDALGVPVEFKGRDDLRHNPVENMIGYGTYSVPPGTWSDDSSLTFCLAEALTEGFDLKAIGQNFVKWYYKNYWTARGKVFDVGGTTLQAIERLARDGDPETSGSFDVDSNGNGSLMMISPLVFYLLDKPVDERFQITKQVSSITHGHIRSVIAYFYYLEFLRRLIPTGDKFRIYKTLQTEVADHLNSLSIDPAEIAQFNRLLEEDIHLLSEEKISSDEYVLHALEASIWSFMTTGNYKDAVLKAINLGEDTDTTGAVTGGLAGLYYGYENISIKWINEIARREEIEKLAGRLGKN